MHQQGLAHLDLKLLNVFVSSKNKERPKVKIGNLGLTCRLVEARTFEKRLGTKSCMSPEMILGMPVD